MKTCMLTEVSRWLTLCINPYSEVKNKKRLPNAIVFVVSVLNRVSE
jgi:hypothetical protein